MFNNSFALIVVVFIFFCELRVLKATLLFIFVVRIIFQLDQNVYISEIIADKLSHLKQKESSFDHVVKSHVIKLTHFVKNPGNEKLLIEVWKNPFCILLHSPDRFSQFLCGHCHWNCWRIYPLRLLIYFDTKFYLISWNFDA